MPKFCMLLDETTVKQRAFACSSCSISQTGLSRFVYVGAIFSAVTTCRVFHLTVIAWRRSWHCCIVRNSRGGKRRLSLQKCANISDCGPISTCATDTRVQPEYSVLLSMLSGEFCLRLKPYLVVKISSDILTEHCCQVCVLAMMFCRSDCRLCAGMCGK